MSAPVLLETATVPEILAELHRRYEEIPNIPDWAAPVVITVAGHYKMPIEVIVSNRRNEPAVKVRHLCIALLAQLHPNRSRTEIAAVVGLEQHMYRHSVEKIEERCRNFPEFRAEVASILQAIRSQKSCKDGHGHCRTSPQGTAPV